jgi:serine/threonine-protein kinase PpkA
MRIREVTLILLIALLFPQWVLLCEGQEARSPIKIEGKESLPLRVLARPFSNVYQGKDTGSQVATANVSVFQPFFVYSQPSAEDMEREAGWYEVGTDNRGKVIGWMQAKDVFEWKQTMCLAFTHPEGRLPVLMFDRRGVLDELIRSSSDERAAKAKELYHRIETQQVPADFPVISVEPKKAIDIAKQFYLLPIINFDKIALDGREARLVRLAAATSGGADAREKTDIRTDSAYLKQAVAGSTAASREIMQQLRIDVVWVMDTTVSMRPYIDRTLEVVKRVSQQISQDPGLAEALGFGIWGYRDSAVDIPGIGYTTFNYTQELQPIDRFTQTLGAVEVTKVDSVDYPEDVFSGVDDAIRKTQWDTGAIRILVLLGDAPGHELRHKWNLSGLNENTLRAIADDASVYLFAFQIREPKARQFHEAAERQFRALSQNRGMAGNSAYWSTASDDLDGFTAATAELTKALTDGIKTAKSGGAVPQPETETTIGQSRVTEIRPVWESGANSPQSGSAGKLADQMIRAAVVEWIGSQSQAKAPRDILAWAVDKDLIKPALPSMEVRLLISKRQLDSLKIILTEVMAAGRRGQVGGEDFFTALQSTSATAARDPNQIKNARSMAHTGLIPEFLTGLPYTSRIMDMSNELWGSWSIDEQDQFLSELEARMKAYRAIHDTPDGWIALNQGDDPDEYVYPINLELLP